MWTFIDQTNAGQLGAAAKWSHGCSGYMVRRDAPSLVALRSRTWPTKRAISRRGPAEVSRICKVIADREDRRRESGDDGRGSAELEKLARMSEWDFERGRVEAAKALGVTARRAFSRPSVVLFSLRMVLRKLAVTPRPWQPPLDRAQNPTPTCAPVFQARHLPRPSSQALPATVLTIGNNFADAADFGRAERRLIARFVGLRDTERH